MMRLGVQRVIFCVLVICAFAISVNASDQTVPARPFNIGSYYGFFGTTSNVAEFQIGLVTEETVTGKILFETRCIETIYRGNSTLSVAFELIRAPEGDRQWGFRMLNPPFDVATTEPSKWIQTPQGLLLSTRLQLLGNGERMEVTVGFWIDPNLSANPARVPSPRKLAITGSLAAGVTRYTAGKGLASNAVRSAIQSADGHMWFGTINGLSRFDGAQWTTFTSSSTPSLPEDNITGLAEDRQGRLIVGTKASGIFYFEQNQFVPLAINDVLAGKWLRDLVVGTDGALWFTLDEEVLGRVSPGGQYQHWSIEDLGYPDGPSVEWGDAIVDLLPRPGGQILVGSTRGLSLLSAQSGLQFVPSAGGTTGLRLATMSGGGFCQSRWNGLRIGDGAYRLIRQIHLPPQYSDIRRIRQSSTGDLWIGSKAGILLFDPRTDSLLKVSGLNDAVYRDIVDLVEDHQGNLWVISGQHGVARLKRQFIETTTSGAESSSIPWQPQTVAAGPDGSLYTSVNSGIDVLKQGEIEHLRVAEGHWHAGIALDLENPDQFWLGITQGYQPLGQRDGAETAEPSPALATWTNSTFDVFSIPGYPEGLTGTSSVTSTRSDGIWIGSVEGAFSFRNGEFHHWNADSKVPVFPVSVIYQTSSSAFGSVAPRVASFVRKGMPLRSALPGRCMAWRRIRCCRFFKTAKVRFGLAPRAGSPVSVSRGTTSLRSRRVLPFCSFLFTSSSKTRSVIYGWARLRESMPSRSMNSTAFVRERFQKCPSQGSGVKTGFPTKRSPPTIFLQPAAAAMATFTFVWKAASRASTRSPQRARLPGRPSTFSSCRPPVARSRYRA
ncbi:MAG: two-component regulator propeller domain-containing protein [Verrucomicrobiales bacterium]